MIKVGKYIIWILMGLLCLILSLYLVIQIPYVQTRIGSMAVAALTKNIDAEINVGDIDIRFFNRLHLTNFSIVSKDTLVAAKDLEATFSLRGLLDKQKRITSVTISDGVFNLISETDSTTNLNRIFPPSNKESNRELNIALKKIKLEKFRFNLYDPFLGKTYGPGQMDFSDLRLSNINAEVSDIIYAADSLKANITNLSAYEKCGMTLEKLTGKVTISSTEANIQNLYLAADGSLLNAQYLSMSFNSAADLKYFTQKVFIRTKFQNSNIAFKTIGRFAPELLTSPLVLLSDAQVEGTVNNMYIKYLNAANNSGQTTIALSNFYLRGLPNAMNTSINGDVKKISTNGKDLAQLISFLPGENKIAFLEQMSPMDIWNFTGRISGTIGNLHTIGTLASAGSSSTDVNAFVNVAKSPNLPTVSVRVNANDINLRSVTGNKMFGFFSGSGRVNVHQGKNGSIVSIDSLYARKLGFNNYNFTGIFAKGTYENELFDGKVICHDPALDLMFQGKISTSIKDGSLFNFYANIPYADLRALNLDTRDSISEISTFISADLKSNSNKDVFGYLKMDNTTFTNSHGHYELGDLDATSLFENGNYVINVISNFVKARYEGSRPINQFFSQMKNQIAYKHFNNIVTDTDSEYIDQQYNQNYSLTLQTLNTQGICAFISPGLYIQEGTSLRIRVSDNDHYRLLLYSGRLAWENNYLKNVRLSISDRDSTISASLFSKDVVASGITVDSTRLLATIQNNRINTSLTFHNDSTGNNKTNLNAGIYFLKDTLFENNIHSIKLQKPIAITLYPSDISIKNTRWDFSPAEILISDSIIAIDNLNILNGNQTLSVEGTLSRSLHDSLLVSMKEFNIAIVDQFLEKKMNLEGLISGKANLSLNANNPKMFASFRGDSMYVNHAPVGTLNFQGFYNEENKRYNLVLNTTLNDKPRLDISGFYRPQDAYIDLNSKLDDLALNYFEPMLASVVTKTDGSLKGNIRIHGPINNIAISGNNCSFNKFQFTLDYLNVPMTLDGPFNIDTKGITFKNNLISDVHKGKGRLNGGIKFNKFKDIQIDARISLDNFHCLNTSEADNEDFYGTVFASGNVNIKGNLKALNLDINARTDRKTFFHIPLSGAANANASDLIKFVQEKREMEIDPYDTLYFSKSKKANDPTELVINLNVTATPDANIWLEVDKSTGDIMKARGNGRIGVKVNPQKNIFDLSGNYTISDGSYHFVLMGLASRDFKIEPGSNVSLNGKIGNTELDISAVYSTKTAINRLISDTTFVSSRLVNSNIKITGILDNPQIKFGIDIPDLDPSIKIQVESALNTEDKIQKQFASLLAFGSFTPDIESGISSTNTALYANASSMLVGQINNLFMQLNIPLDLGFNYQQGDKTANDVFEVAVSTQLFNNRVIINGSMGNDPYSYYTGRDVKGDIDIEVKMDRQGKVRMTLFSHSTDFYSNDLYLSQRTGIGVAYQHDFNSFKDIFRKKSAAQKEYEKMLRIKEREERKAKRQAKKNKKEQD